MADGGVSEELCASRRDVFNVKLDAIQAQTAETRSGVGKMLQIVTEGNGSPALVTSVAQNASFKKTMEAWLIQEREDRKLRVQQEAYDRRQRRVIVLLATGGWLVTIALFAIGMVFKV